MITITRKGLFHSNYYDKTQNLSFPKPISNVVKFTFDHVIVEPDVTFFHVMKYLIIDHISFVESVFAKYIGEATLQKFVDELSLPYSDDSPFSSIILTWNYAHNYDDFNRNTRGIIFSDIKGKVNGPRKLPIDSKCVSLAFTPLNQIKNIPFIINEELHIFSSDEKKICVCNRAFNVADLVAGTLSEICEFRSPEERDRNLKSFQEATKRSIEKEEKPPEKPNDNEAGDPVLV